MKNTFLICLFTFSAAGIWAQIDNNTVEDTDLFQYQPNQSDHKKFEPEKAEGAEIKAEIVTLFGSIKDIADNFPTYSVIPEKKKKNMTGRRQHDKDVMVRQYWNGSDLSIKKFKTSLELGKLETESRTIRIVCRDHSYVDGDRVKLYVNEVVIRRSITLEAGYYSIDIQLNDGFNRIDIEALNQGSSGPNTAEFKVFDENGVMLASREWNILTGYIATLVVMKR